MLPPQVFKDKVAYVTGGGTGLGKISKFLIKNKLKFIILKKSKAKQ